MKSIAAIKFNESGISPLELVMHKVLRFGNKTQVGSFTEVYVNSLGLGTLTPAQYRVVTNRNNQSLRLSTWAFRKLVALPAEEKDSAQWTSFYVPSKALMNGFLRNLLENERKKNDIDFSWLVVELSSEILYEDAKNAALNMDKLREEFGIRFLLSEFGDEYCPILRLPLYPVDFVLLDSSIDSKDAIKASSAAVKIAKQNNKTVIARLRHSASGLQPDISPDCIIEAFAGYERREL